MIRTVHQGLIYLEPWEFLVLPFLVIMIFIISSRIKNTNIKKHPEYKYYLLGLYAKIFGGLCFALVYVYYYGGGDTMTYYETSLAMVNMLMKDPLVYFETLFSSASREIYYKYDSSTGYPVGYIYYDPKTFMVSRLTSPLVLIGLKSYLLTTILVAWATYGGLWKLYQMFARYYPERLPLLAAGVLFIPSTIFWGSGILKDSFTLAATGWYVYNLDKVFVRRQFKFRSVLLVFISAFILISLKPYIFMVLFPGSLYWIFNDKLAKIKNKLVKYVLLPFAYVIVIAGSFFILDSLGDELGSFSLDNALQTAAIKQQDLTSAHYEGNSFDIGEFEPTMAGVLAKFIPATVAGLFRPFIWETKNPAMLVSGLENLFLMLLFAYALIKSRVVFFFNILSREPILVFCLIFTVSFGFIIGLSTANFGALVRFKIPLLPFFATSMLLVGYQVKLGRQKRKEAEELRRTQKMQSARRGLAAKS